MPAPPFFVLESQRPPEFYLVLLQMRDTCSGECRKGYMDHWPRWYERPFWRLAGFRFKQTKEQV